MFKPNDIVRRIGGNYTFVRFEKNYVVDSVSSDTSRLKLKELDGTPVKGGYLYPAVHFELVESSSDVDVQIKGSIIARGSGGVSVKLNDGTVVLIPEKLVPEDPKFAKFRDMVAQYEREYRGTANECAVRNGNRDAILKKVFDNANR